MPRLAAELERAYVAAATHQDFTLDPFVETELADADSDLRGMLAAAAIGAVASRYLAVGTPRSIGLVGDAAACAASLAAHRAWFAPVDVRWVAPAGVSREAHGGGDFGSDRPRLVSLGEALAADIVCVHAKTTLSAQHVRRGTHVNALAPVDIDPTLAAVVVDELAPIAAGLVDGRTLDEITVYTALDLAIGLAVFA